MENEFLRLKFHFFFLVFFGVSNRSSSSFFVGRSEDQIVPLQIRSSSSNRLFVSLDRASNRSSSVFLQISKFKSVFLRSSFFDSRSEDQIVPLQIRSSSSNRLFVSSDHASNCSSSVFLQISKFKSVLLFWNSSLRDSRSID